jgi:hypothetical protein
MQKIFLTSLPRSGSTWASQTISVATRSRLIHEPFNWKRYPDREKYHMLYLPAGSNRMDLIDILENVSRPKLPFFNKLLIDKPLFIKDVHICLAMEYVWEQIEPYIIILIRHPCGMANSWMKLRYEVRFRLDLLLSQPRLMADYLSPFERHLRHKGDKWFEIGAYWGATHYILDQLSINHNEWVWSTHEELCIDSEKAYHRLLSDLGVKISTKGEKRLHAFINRHNRIKAKKPYSVSRISAKEPDKWHTQMTPEQVKSVIEGAEPFDIMPKFFDAVQD